MTAERAPEAPRDERLLSDRELRAARAYAEHREGVGRMGRGGSRHLAFSLLAHIDALTDQLAAAEGRAYKVDQYVKEWRLRFAEECSTLDTSQSYDSDFVLNLTVAIHTVMAGGKAEPARADGEA